MTSVYFVVTAFTKICTPAYEYAPIRTHSLTNARPAVYHKSIIGKTLASCDQLEIILYDINNAIYYLPDPNTSPGSRLDPSCRSPL